jgi:tetratricopeptide (TPR) repeat protein
MERIGKLPPLARLHALTPRVRPSLTTVALCLALGASFLLGATAHALLVHFSSSPTPFEATTGAPADGPQRNFEEGVAAQDAGDYVLAIKRYSAALMQDSNFVNAYVRRGESYGAVGNWPAVIADYAQAARLSDSGDLYLRLGDVYRQVGRIGEARAAYQRAAELLPKTPATFALLAERLHSVQASDRAIALLQQALDQEPQDWQLWRLLGDIRAGTREWRAASEAYARALELAPPSGKPQVHLHRAGAYLAAGDLGKAVTDYEAAIQLQPNNPDLYLSLGNAYAGYRNEWPKAIDAYTRALRINPNYVPAYLQLASLEQQQGNLSAALHYWQTALPLATDPATRARIEAQIKRYAR